MRYCLLVLPELKFRIHQEQKALDKNVTARERDKLIAAMQKATIAVIGTTGGAVGALFPPALLVMPVLVPLVVLVSEVFRFKNKKQIKGTSVIQ